MQLRRGKVFLKPRVDVIMDGDTDNKYLGLLAEDLKTAREKADYVIVCSGGRSTGFGSRKFEELSDKESKYKNSSIYPYGIRKRFHMGTFV